jgi:hypothetical protein
VLDKHLRAIETEGSSQRIVVPWTSYHALQYSNQIAVCFIKVQALLPGCLVARDYTQLSFGQIGVGFFDQVNEKRLRLWCYKSVRVAHGDHGKRGLRLGDQANLARHVMITVVKYTL